MSLLQDDLLNKFKNLGIVLQYDKLLLTTKEKANALAQDEALLEAPGAKTPAPPGAPPLPAAPESPPAPPLPAAPESPPAPPPPAAPAAPAAPEAAAPQK